MIIKNHIETDLVNAIEAEVKQISICLAGIQLFLNVVKEEARKREEEDV
jgi:hypothetical protein